MYYTRESAAEHFDVSTWQIDVWRKQGLLRPIKNCGRTVRFSEAAVAACEAALEPEMEQAS